MWLSVKPPCSHLAARRKKRISPGRGDRGLKNGRRGGGVGGCLPPNSKIDHVDGGFAAGASSFSRHGSPRSSSCATAWSTTAKRSSSVRPCFKPCTIFRERCK